MPDPRAPRSRPAARRRGLPPPGLEWAPDDVPALARAAGLGPLTDQHWKILSAFREEAVRTGSPPTQKRMFELTGLEPEELRTLFPGDSAALLARLAGIPRPASGPSVRRGTNPPGRTHP